MQKPFLGRAKIREPSDAIEIVIPKRKDVEVLLPLIFTFLPSLFFAVFALYTIISKTTNPTSGWFILCLFGGFTIISFLQLLRTLVGIEITHFLNDSITVTERVLRYSREHIYASAHISRLRTLQIIERSQFDGSQTWTGGIPSLAFDYGAKTIRFGRGMDEAEAAQILERIMTKFPQYRSSSQSNSA